MWRRWGPSHLTESTPSLSEHLGSRRDAGRISHSAERTPGGCSDAAVLAVAHSSQKDELHSFREANDHKPPLHWLSHPVLPPVVLYSLLPLSASLGPWLLQDASRASAPDSPFPATSRELPATWDVPLKKLEQRGQLGMTGSQETFVPNTCKTGSGPPLCRATRVLC